LPNSLHMPHYCDANKIVWSHPGLKRVVCYHCQCMFVTAVRALLFVCQLWLVRRFCNLSKQIITNHCGVRGYFLPLFWFSLLCCLCDVEIWVISGYVGCLIGGWKLFSGHFAEEQREALLNRQCSESRWSQISCEEQLCFVLYPYFTPLNWTLLQGFTGFLGNKLGFGCLDIILFEAMLDTVKKRWNSCSRTVDRL